MPEYGEFISANGILFRFTESRTEYCGRFYDIPYEVWDCRLDQELPEEYDEDGITWIHGDYFQLEPGLITDCRVIGESDPRCMDGAGI